MVKMRDAEEENIRKKNEGKEVEEKERERRGGRCGRGGGGLVYIRTKTGERDEYRPMGVSAGKIIWVPGFTIFTF